MCIFCSGAYRSAKNVLCALMLIFLFLFFSPVSGYSAAPPDIRVGLSLSGNAVEISFDSCYELINMATGASLQLPPGRYKLLNVQNNVKVLNSVNNNCGIYKGPLYLKPLLKSQFSSETFLIHNAVYGNEYRGALEVFPVENSLKAVNVIDIESYLRAVIPAEMPAAWGGSGGMEALKAQAVAARSYALYSRDLQRHNGYHVCDAVHCQLYAGKRAETDNTDNAVIQTLEEVLTYKGEIIEPFYCATNGGYTELSQNVMSNALPYYEAVEDLYDDPANPLGINDFNFHRYGTWEKDIPLETLGSILVTGGYGDPGEVERVYVASAFESGRVRELRIEGTKGVVSLFMQDARFALGLRSQLYTVVDKTEPRVWIASALNNIETLDSFSELDKKWVVSGHTIKNKLIGEHFSALGNGAKGEVPYPGCIFIGYGSGHAVGMSQNGAYNRSKAGHSYREILSFYYPNAQITASY